MAKVLKFPAQQKANYPHDAMVAFDALIEHKFALESVIIVRGGWLYNQPGHRMGIWLEPGTYPVGDELVVGVTTSIMKICTPRLAHHLRTCGLADVKYKNGRIDAARVFPEYRPLEQTFGETLANALAALFAIDGE